MNTLTIVVTTLGPMVAGRGHAPPPLSGFQTIVTNVGSVLGLIAQAVTIASGCVGILMVLRQHARTAPAQQVGSTPVQARPIPSEVMLQQAASLPQLAQRLFRRRLALGGVAVSLLAVIILLGRDVLAKRPPSWTSASAFGIAAAALLLIMGLLSVDQLLTGTPRYKRRLALGSAAWVLSLTSAPLLPYVIAVHQYSTWAPVAFSGTVLSTLIVVSILALDPWTGHELPAAYGLALGTIALSSLVSAALLWARAPWWYLDRNVEYSFVGCVLAMLIVSGLLIAEFRARAPVNVMGPIGGPKPAM